MTGSGRGILFEGGWLVRYVMMRVFGEAWGALHGPCQGNHELEPRARTSNHRSSRLHASHLIHVINYQLSTLTKQHTLSQIPHFNITTRHSKFTFTLPDFTMFVHYSVFIYSIPEQSLISFYQHCKDIRDHSSP